MCGLLGIYQRSGKPVFSQVQIKQVLRQLFIESQSRGKDSSGILTLDEKEMRLAKHSCNASILVESKPFAESLNLHAREYFSAIGHSRMETNGSFVVPENNQPVERENVFTIHNGIITNIDELWNQRPYLQRKYQVDTEIVSAMFFEAISKKTSLGDFMAEIFNSFEGSYSLGMLGKDSAGLVLTSNTGSLHILTDKNSGLMLFASERLFIHNLQQNFPALNHSGIVVRQVEPGTVVFLDFATGNQIWTNLVDLKKDLDFPMASVSRAIKVMDMRAIPSSVPQPVVHNKKDRTALERAVEIGFKRARDIAGRLKRCTRCVLPETMPFIQFNEEGVCNYCYRYQKKTLLGMDRLHADLESFRKKHGSKCVLSFSGGRDSSYALHVVAKKLNMKILAFTYDWGMLTDLGRRNQARMVGKLGIEHILVSADIQKKRANIRKNVKAWLRRPQLGLIPLFMAGDKQYFYYLNQVRQTTGVDLLIYAENVLEKTDFKYGFANVDIGTHFGKGYDIGALRSLKLAWYYFYQSLLNPGYYNSSIVDTIGAYFSSYAVPKEYIYLFNYIPWIEDEITNTLVEEYNWELAPDTKSSWRIGDGTQAFYNYIYYLGSGLTEHDTFRSNQIREGLMDRQTAMELIERDNIPRIDSLIWYFDVIGLSALEAIERVNQMSQQRFLEIAVQ